MFRPDQGEQRTGGPWQYRDAQSTESYGIPPAEEGVRRGCTHVSLKGKFYLVLAIIVIGGLIGMNNPQPGP